MSVRSSGAGHKGACALAGVSNIGGIMESVYRGLDCLRMWRFDAVSRGRVVGSCVALNAAHARDLLRQNLQRALARDWWACGGVVRKGKEV